MKIDYPKFKKTKCTTCDRGNKFLGCPKTKANIALCAGKEEVGKGDGQR